MGDGIHLEHTSGAVGIGGKAVSVDIGVDIEEGVCVGNELFNGALGLGSFDIGRA